MNRIFTRFAGVLAITCASAASMATTKLEQVNVGQSVALNFKTIDGGAVGGKDLKGKVTVLEFWKTDCPICMGHMSQVKQLSEDYAPKGVQLIGIGLDPTADALRPVIKDKEMTWPQVHDAGDVLQRKYGVTATPTLFIVGPDSVVRWRGNIKELEKALGDVLEKYPPVLVEPKVLKVARDKLAQAEARLAAGDGAAAITLTAAIPEEASKDPAFAKALEGMRGKLDAPARDVLKAAGADAAAGRNAEASRRLREVSAAMAGQPAGDDAKAQLEAMRAAKPAQKKSAAGGAARKDAGDAGAADSAATPAAAKQDAPNPAARAKAALSIARGYAGTGRTDAAIRKYESIVKDYPNTEFAKTAQAEIEKLKK